MKSKYYCHICGIVSGFQTYTTCFLELKSMYGFKLEFTHVKKEAQHIWVKYKQPNAFYGKEILDSLEKYMNYWMTIDPGINLGWALFSGKKLKEYGTISGKGKTWEEKVENVVGRLLCWTFMTTVFIEWPSFQSMEAQNTGSIIKLAYLIGRAEQAYRAADYRTKVVLIPVIVWKGQTPKIVTAERVKEWLSSNQPNFKLSKISNHAMDAIGLGKYIIEETNVV